MKIAVDIGNRNVCSCHKVKGKLFLSSFQARFSTEIQEDYMNSEVIEIDRVKYCIEQGQGAKTFLGNENCLQLIFFTHDEQFMNTLFLKKAPFVSATMARLLDCRYVKSWFNGNYSDDGGIRYYTVLSEFKRNKR